MKLTTRLKDPSQVDRIRRLLSSRTSDLSIEVQQRAVEYGNLFAYEDIRRGVLERMPPPEIREEQRVLGEATPKQKKAAAKGRKPAKPTEQDMLLDLMGGPELPASDLSPTVNGSQNNADLLADILGGGVSSPTNSAPSSQTNQNVMDLFSAQTATNGLSSPQAQPSSASADLFDGLSPASPAPQAALGGQFHQAYSKNDMHVMMQVQRNAGLAQVTARFQNTSNFDRFSGVGLQAAVPKSQKLQLNAMSKADLEGGEEATQQMRVTAVSGALPSKLRLRLKVSYTKDGRAPITDQVDWTEPT